MRPASRKRWRRGRSSRWALSPAAWSSARLSSQRCDLLGSAGGCSGEMLQRPHVLTLLSHRSTTREEPTTTMSSSAPSSPCWLRKVRGLAAAPYLACPAQSPGPQAPSFRPLPGLEQTVVSGRAERASASDRRLWPVERVAAGHPATLSRACASPQACWPTWWSRTSRCGGARGSALADSTSSGSLTGGNAHAPTRPSASEDCWP